MDQINNGPHNAFHICIASSADFVGTNTSIWQIEVCASESAITLAKNYNDFSTLLKNHKEIVAANS